MAHVYRSARTLKVAMTASVLRATGKWAQEISARLKVGTFNY